MLVLQATVLASVIVLLVLVLLVLAANVWLEVERGATAGGQAAGEFVCLLYGAWLAWAAVDSDTPGD